MVTETQRLGREAEEGEEEEEKKEEGEEEEEEEEEEEVVVVVVVRGQLPGTSESFLNCLSAMKTNSKKPWQVGGRRCNTR